MTENTFNFDEIFKPLTDAFKEASEQINLATQCKMRRFYLIRTVDVVGISGMGVVAEGVIFEDGQVAMRWKTKTASSSIYKNIADVQAIHCHNGMTIVKYVDSEVKR